MIKVRVTVRVKLVVVFCSPDHYEVLVAFNYENTLYSTSIKHQNHVDSLRQLCLLSLP